MLNSSTTTTRNTYLSTPGEILAEEFLEPLHISRYKLAKATGISQTALGEIVNGTRRITVPTAYLLAAALGTTPQFWLKLQMDYDTLSYVPPERVKKVPLLV